MKRCLPAIIVGLFVVSTAGCRGSDGKGAVAARSPASSQAKAKTAAPVRTEALLSESGNTSIIDEVETPYCYVDANTYCVYESPGIEGYRCRCGNRNGRFRAQ